MLVADVNLGTIGQWYDGDRLGFRVQRMHGLKIVQDDIEGRPAKCGRTSHLNIDAPLVEIGEHQRLAIAHAEDDAGPPAGFIRRQILMGLDNESWDQTRRQIVVYITKAQRVLWPFVVVVATVRRQGLWNEIAFLPWRWQAQAEADILILHHVQDEFMPLQRVPPGIKPVGELGSGKLALLMD